MTDKDKIKSEIESRISNIEYSAISSPQREGAKLALNSILDFINSLPEEPVSSVWHDAREEPNRTSNLMLQFENNFHKPVIANPMEGDFPWEKVVKLNRISKWAYLDDLLKVDTIKQEESVSEDFEEEMDRYIEENFYGSADDGFFSNRTKRELEVEDVVRIGCHFAAWQKEQDKETIELAEDHAMLTGMEKMREQMIKDAIPANILTNQHGNKYIQSWSGLKQYDKYKNGDEVKIIIIKKE